MNARDTTSEARAVQTAVFRRMSPSHRSQLSARMSLEVRRIALAGIRHRHPDYDEETARLALFRLLLGDELFARAWPEAPLVAP